MQGGIDADSLASRLRELGERSGTALETVDCITRYMEAALERGLNTAQVRKFFDFCIAEPELALVLALIAGVFGVRAGVEHSENSENFEGSDADFAPLGGSR